MAINNAPDYKILLADVNPNSPTHRDILGVDPKMGVPVPTARVMGALPATGISPGELVHAGGVTSIWDGTRWLNIAGSNIEQEATDAHVYARTSDPDGTIASAVDSGNTYVRAGGRWRIIGVRLFPTEVDLLASSLGDGSIGIAQDTGNIWTHNNGAWEILGIHRFTTQADLMRASPSGVGLAYARDTHTMFYHTGNEWVAVNIEYFDTQAHLLAADFPIGTFAVALDMRNMWMMRSDGSGGREWSSVGTRYYDNPAQMLGDSPHEGTTGVDLEYGTQAFYKNGKWNVTNRRIYTDRATLLADNPQATPFLAFAVAEGELYYWTGSDWIPFGILDVPDLASPLVQANLGDGSILYDESSSNTFFRRAGSWQVMGIGYTDNEQSFLTGGVMVGTTFIALDTGNRFIGVEKPTGPEWVRVNTVNYPNEAARLADTHMSEGNIGVDLDTGHVFTYTQGSWRGWSPAVWATEAALTASTPPDGQFAIAEDTRRMYIRAGGAWHKQQGTTTTISDTEPTSGTLGDIWIDDTDTSKLVWHVYDGTNFVELKAGAEVTKQDSEPSNPVKGDVWLDDGGGTNVPTAAMYDGSAWFNLGVGYKRGSGDPPRWSNARYGDIYTDTSTGVSYIAASSEWNRFTTIDMSMWEKIRTDRRPSITNGYTVSFPLDWGVWDTVRIYMAWQAQSLLLGSNGNAGGYCHTNWNKHDGGGTYKGLNLNAHQDFAPRSHGALQIWIQRMPGQNGRWVGQIVGFSAHNAGDWSSGSGDWWSWSGQYYIRHGPHFGSYAGETGALTFICEGIRQF